MGEHLDTILVSLLILVSVSYIGWQFWKSRQAKEACCGGRCGCATSKARHKVLKKKLD